MGRGGCLFIVHIPSAVSALVSGFISRHKGGCGPSFRGTDKPQKSGNVKYYKGNEKEKWDRAEVWGCIILGKVVRNDFSEKVTFELRLE